VITSTCSECNNWKLFTALPPYKGECMEQWVEGYGYVLKDANTPVCGKFVDVGQFGQYLREGPIRETETH
jgi:hypothetical protein